MLLVLAWSAVAGATDVRPALGHRAPDFTLPDPEGRSVWLSGVLREKAVLLNFWATWCPPCRRELPTMEEAYRAYRTKGLEVLAVSIDAGGAEAVARKVSCSWRSWG